MRKVSMNNVCDEWLQWFDCLNRLGFLVVVIFWWWLFGCFNSWSLIFSVEQKTGNNKAIDWVRPQQQR